MKRFCLKRAAVVDFSLVSIGQEKSLVLAVTMLDLLVQKEPINKDKFFNACHKIYG